MLDSCRAASVSSEVRRPGRADGPDLRLGGSHRADRQVALGILQVGHGGAELRVEALHAVQRALDVGDLLLHEQDLAAQLRVLLLQDPVLRGGAHEEEVVAHREQRDERHGAEDDEPLAQPAAGQVELPHRLRVVADDDDGVLPVLGRGGHGPFERMSCRNGAAWRPHFGSPRRPVRQHG
jgi:hypothetical protein